MTRVATAIAMAAVLSVAAAQADRCSIPFRPHVRIFEPTQRAMIAWDGTEEILLLSTDLRASERTKVLEVIPLPTEPKVKKGDVDVFKRAVALINQKINLPLLYRAARARGAKEESARVPAGEVTFHKKIGPHDISVTRVRNSEGFVKWVEDYLKNAGVDNPVIPEPVKQVIAEYLEDDYTWFVFDVIELGEKPITNDAIQYRFRTGALYYPLRVTRTEVGNTSIELLILTPRLLSRFPAYPKEKVRLMHEPVSITSSELRRLSEDMDDLLEHRDDLKLRIWRITGKLSAFRDDLIAH